MGPLVVRDNFWVFRGGEKAMQLGVNCAYWDPIFSSAIPYWDRKEREERVARYTLTKTLLT